MCFRTSSSEHRMTSLKRRTNGSTSVTSPSWCRRYVCMYVMYVCMYVCYVCMYVMYVCMHVCYVCMYLHIHKRSFIAPQVCAFQNNQDIAHKH